MRNLNETLQEKLNAGEARPPEFQGLRLNIKSRTLEVDGTSVSEPLSDSEYLLLWLFIRSHGGPITEEEMREFIKDTADRDITGIKTTEVQLTHLRTIVKRATKGKLTISYGSPDRGFVLIKTDEPYKNGKADAAYPDQFESVLEGGLGAKLNDGVERRAEFGPLWLSLNSRSLNVSGKSESTYLNDQEFQVLWLLIRAQGTVIATREMEDFIYSDRPEDKDRPMTNVMESVIGSLREKLELAAGHSVSIATVKGFGYKIQESTSENAK